ncbi:MAG: selenocysteine-specific translation elongation factor [Mailhella sp.]|nr:selenocysteine-specific translation elongation factor [Mailhella sp.]
MSIVMGTAGHIDHGKTSLVKALTGKDCDRLEEEKKRGITIELGFSFLPLADGTRLGIVDVPGHEKFIRNMVAGASGIDFVLMVIAADEGVMPQTREHLEICSLLGIREGLVALTKADMVDEEMLELAREDVAESLRGTFLEGAPIIPVSSVTGDGLDALKAEIAAKTASLSPRGSSDILRLPVDRVFSIRGYGTIVTGTLVSGRARPDDEAEVVPSGLRSRIKSIQSHDVEVASAEPGHRISMNLSGLEVKDIRKGDIISRPGSLFPSDRWLISLTCLPSAPRGLKQREEIHFHHGTKEVQARLYFPDRDVLEPGRTSLAEVRFDTPMAGIFGDRCVVRLFSPLRTAAGGTVLVPVPYGVKLRRIPEQTRARLMGMPSASPEEVAAAQIAFAGPVGVDWAHLAALTCLDEKKLDKAVQALARSRSVYCFHRESRSYVSAEMLEMRKAAFMERAAEFHRQNPLEKGMARGWLFDGSASNSGRQMGMFVLNQLLKEGRLVQEGDILRVEGFKVEMQVDEEALAARILAAMRETPRTPPKVTVFAEENGISEKAMQPVLRVLAQKGELVKVSEEFYFDAAEMERIRSIVREWFMDNSDLSVGPFKDLLGITRRHAIPLLEYLDASRFTVRVGDERRLRTVSI